MKRIFVETQFLTESDFLLMRFVEMSYQWKLSIILCSNESLKSRVNKWI